MIDDIDALIDAEVTRERVKREARRRLESEDRVAAPIPERITLRERLARPRVATAWRIHRWQPRGSRVLMAAQFKAGKTSLRDNYVRCLADGDDFLGVHAVSAVSGTIAIVDTEMHENQAEDWLRDQRIRRDDKVIPWFLRGNVRGFDILDPQRRAEWAKQFRGDHVDTFVLDCFRPLLDAFGLDEHRDAGRVLVAIDALLYEAEIPDALIIHHMGHMNERARGDSRLLDWPDVLWKVVRQDDQPSSPRFISAYGRDVDVPESQLAYEGKTRRLTLLGGSRQDAKATSALDAVAGLLDERPGLSGHAVWTAMKDDNTHAKHAIEAALKLGLSNERLRVQRGPRGANLYFSVPASRTFPKPSREGRSESVSELPSFPYREGSSGHTDGTPGELTSFSEVIDVDRF